MITRNFKLFLNAGKQIPLMINVSQYDHGEKWVFTLYDDHGQKYTPSTGAIVGIKADKKGIINTGTVNSAGQVEIMETQQMTAAAGKAVFELLIDGDTHGTANFVVLVEPKPGDQADMSTSDLSLLQQAINSIAIAGSGAPAVATLAADMTDEGKIYLYAGSEVGYTAGDWYYYNGASWVDGGKYGGTVDATLTQPGQAADAKKVGDEINDLKSQINQLEAIPWAVKQAMDTLFQNMPFKNTDVYTDELATFHAWATSVDVVSLSAVYTQSGIVYDDDSLDDLKSDLVVTAHYSDDTTGTVSTYTLSGTLTAGTSVITVAYGGKSTTFNVTVSAGVPNTYTKYDYIGLNVNNKTIGNEGWITLKEFDNLDDLSFILKFKPLTGYTKSSFVLGNRAESAVATSVSVYIGSNSSSSVGASDKARVVAHGNSSAYSSNTINLDEINTIEFRNTSSSPSTYVLNGVENSLPWTEHLTVNKGFVLFCNPPTPQTEMTVQGSRQIGEFKLFSLDGTLVGDYIPVKRLSDNVVGMFDRVDQIFYTTPTVSYATIGNADCFYEVGNWS